MFRLRDAELSPPFHLTSLPAVAFSAKFCALESLPLRSRQVLVLRELEGCSYQEIADIAGIPLGTVMSSLSRARGRLQRALTGAAAKEAS